MKLVRLAEVNRRQPADHPPSVAPEATVSALIASGGYELDQDDLIALAKVQGLLAKLPGLHASSSRILDYLNQSSFVHMHRATDEAKEVAQDITRKRDQLYKRLSQDEQRVCVDVATALLG